ncbi:serine/threonine-protein phosphatase 6 regulatory ankyrin repeat subunit B-like isoform X2 [Daphnia pulicaria]|uniref:serine/threonine-protein phosphatase 6 regulatory ankyrin repeat subunit B-like isoform X2 n=1 Tax=Daphnia pulicaria TaxID=35523 RepID=UPI001EE9D5D3|nr:serine/threonine-protein phosphatase 6 regulatory ankyrin repeat subunit B-like isoform X2 [Daphnia pulicaria]
MTDISMLCGLLILCVCYGMLTKFGGTYWQKVSDLSRPILRRHIERVLSSIPFVRDYFGAESQQKLLFVPDADNQPEGEHEISEPALFRFLLNEETLEDIKKAKGEIPDMLNVLRDINKESKITEFETHQSSMGTTKDLKRAFHVFIVFKTTCQTDKDYWWSLEKNRDYIVLQRSRNKNNVKDKCYGETRNEVKPIVENLVGNGTIKDLFAILWAHQIIPEKYNILNSNCQSFVTFISQEITEIGYQYDGFFKYSPPPESGRNQKMLDLINILRGRFELSPLFTLIVMENIDLVDKMMASGKYDINALHNGLTPLHFAIVCSRTKMVQHLLKDTVNADPTRRDASGRSALQLAVTITMKADIFDLLLAHSKVKIDEVDGDGETALHLAAYLSNAIAVQKLLEKGANPNVSDKKGRSPLHLAAQQRDDDAIIDFFLAHCKVRVDDVDVKGQTALHLAVVASNVIAVKKLIEKGANLSIFDKEGLSVLHVAAQERDGNPIIDLLLKAQKVKGMGDVNDQNENGWTALHYAASKSNEITAEHLINKGADLHCRNNYGDTPLHMAATFATDMNIIDVLLQNIHEGDIGQFRNDRKLFFYATHNVHGLGVEIGDRFLKKGIEPPTIETDECSQEMDEIPEEGNFDINGRDSNGETPLFFAIQANNVNGVRRLLGKGADPTIRNNEGFTPFHVAVALNKDSKILNLLLLANEKVDVNETLSQGRTTGLHMAIATSNVTTARFLLSNGANPNAADDNGFTPLHWAARFAKDMDTVELLLDHKDTNVNCLDNEGHHSALDYAKVNTHGHGERIAIRLKEKGAVERKNKLLQGTNEIMKKHMRVFSNDKLRKFAKFLSDDTKTMEAKIDKISERKEYVVSAIRDSNVASIRILLKSGAGDRTWGEEGANALHLASLSAKTTDLIDAILETRKFDINGVDNDGWTPLHYAIMGTNLEINTRHLIGKGTDPDIADKKGYTPLHYAAFNAKEIEIETISLILKNQHVDINHINKGGETYLHYAIKASNAEMARCLLEKGADPTIRNTEGNNSFQLAALFLTDTHVLGLMLGNEKKIEIDERDKQGRTALHLAIATSNVTAARFLLSNGANPNVADEDGLTALHQAAKYVKDMDIVELLLNHKDINVHYLDNQGNNALYYAKVNMFGHGKRIAKLLKEKGVVSQNANSLNDEKVENEVTFENNVKGILQKAFLDSEVGMARFLIHTGVDISTVTWGEEGWNALHMASICAKTTEILDVILATGQFDIKGCDVNGATALHFALRAKNMTTARYLLEKGADPAISDKNGVTPLHWAAYFETTTDIISRILKRFLVDINCRDVNGSTALHYAIMASNVITARCLLKKGADPTVRDNKGYTPLHIAAEMDKDSDILNLLVSNEKVDINETTSQDRRTAVHLAIIKSNVTAAHFLLSNGANPSVADKYGRTPLHWAALLAKDMNIVALLLNHKGTNVNYLDNEGNDALHYAMKNIHGLSERIANRLKEKGFARVEEKIFQADLLDECTGGKAIGHSLDNNNYKNENETESLEKAALYKVVVDSDGNKTLSSPLIKKGAELDKGKCDEMHLASRYAEMKGIVDKLLTVLHGPTAPNCISDAIDENLLNDKFDIDHRNQFGMTALHRAVMESNRATAGFLLSKGANPNAADQNGVTPLHLAAYFANMQICMDIVKLLLNHKDTNVNYLDNVGKNVLHYAQLNKYGLGEAIADLLREKGASKAEGIKHKPKNIAAPVPDRIQEDSDIKTIRFLIENGQDISALTWGEDGANALHVAAANEETTELIDVILETEQCNINPVDSDGRTPLHYAIKRPDPVTINARRLIKMGADPGIADKNGVTPLHMAARNAESMDLIELLLNTEAVDVNCVDKQGQTPLACARDNTHGLAERIIARLREYDDME